MNPEDTNAAEALEARLTAWVLGEVSAEEAETLHRACAEAPALARLHEEIRQVHLMIGELSDSTDDWKLSEKRRAEIEALFEKEPLTAKASLATSRMQQVKPWLVTAGGIAACAMVGFQLYEGSMLRERSAPVVHRLEADFKPPGDAYGVTAASPAYIPESSMQAPMEEEVSLAGSTRARAMGLPAATSPVRPEKQEELALSEPQPNEDPFATASQDLEQLLSSLGGVGSGGGKGRGLGMAQQANSEGVPYALMDESAKRQVVMAKAKSSDDYGKIAAELLAGADSAWELAVPSTSEDRSANEQDGLFERKRRDNKQPSDDSSVSQLTTGKLGPPIDAINPLNKILGDEDDGNSVTASYAESESTTKRPEEVSQIVTGGLRSGDGAISRNSIDEIRTNPALKRKDGVEVEFQKNAASKTVVVKDARTNESKADREGNLYGAVARPGTTTALPADSEKTKKDYEEALRTDPYNNAARRGMEKSPVAASHPTNTDAKQQPFCDFSLNVSDASFRLAVTKVREQQAILPSEVKIEQFYNAFDYGDPEPPASLPIAVKMEQSAHPLVSGTNLLRIALKTTGVGRQASQPLNLTLLVDRSGSMERPDRKAALIEALKQLKTLLKEKDTISVIHFSRTPTLVAEKVSGNRLAELTRELQNQTGEGGTNLEEALKLAGEVAENQGREGEQNRIVLFTDGAANLGDANPAELKKQVETLREHGLALDIVGVGLNELNDQLLSEIARHGNGRYSLIDSAKDGTEFAQKLGGAFRPTAENVKVEVRFNPERVTRYRLHGYEKDRLSQKDFHDDKVDAAELAAAEAGLALFMVEPRAEGKGDIGEVRVRFRDLAKNKMVEQAWAIPYQPQVEGFAQAPPSLQLAGLALTAAERYKNNPEGWNLDEKTMTTVLGQIEPIFSKQGRIEDLQRLLKATPTEPPKD